MTNHRLTNCLTNSNVPDILHFLNKPVYVPCGPWLLTLLYDRPGKCNAFFYTNKMSGKMDFTQEKCVPCHINLPKHGKFTITWQNKIKIQPKDALFNVLICTTFSIFLIFTFNSVKILQLSNISNIKLWVKLQFEWHSNFSDIPILVTFQF